MWKVEEARKCYRNSTYSYVVGVYVIDNNGKRLFRVRKGNTELWGDVVKRAGKVAFLHNKDIQDMYMTCWREYDNCPYKQWDKPGVV